VEGAADVKGEVLAAISQIRNCTSQQGADDAALAFCYVNSKGARRRLVSPPPPPAPAPASIHHSHFLADNWKWEI